MAIEILIKTSGDDLNESPANPLKPDAESKDKDDKKVDGKLSKEQLAILKFATTQAKTWASTGFKAYTDFTGNTMLQQKVDNALTAMDVGITVAGSFAVHPVMGFITVGGYVASAGMHRFQSHMEHKKAQRTLSFVEQGMGARNINGGNYGG